MNLNKLKELYPKIKIIIDSDKNVFDEYNHSIKDCDASKPDWEEGSLTIKVMVCGKEITTALKINNTETIEEKLSQMIEYLIFDKSRKS